MPRIHKRPAESPRISTRLHANLFIALERVREQIKKVLLPGQAEMGAKNEIISYLIETYIARRPKDFVKEYLHHINSQKK